MQMHSYGQNKMVSQPATLYRLTISDIERATNILCKAFINYPTICHLFPNQPERQKKIQHVMRFFLECGLHHGNVFAPTKEIEAVAIWYKSENLDMGLQSFLRSGLIRLMYNLHFRSFSKFKKIGDTKKLHRDRLFSEEYYFLDVIGTDPAHEKKGYAKLLINAMLEQADKEKKSCVLETSSVNNIAYYKNFGFNIISNYDNNGLEYFCMARK